MFSRARNPQSPSEAKKKELLSELFPEAISSALDTRNRNFRQKLACIILRKSFQLLLSSEIGPVENDKAENHYSLMYFL